MRKIDREYENPIDNINIDVADKLCPLFRKMGFSANGITTLSLIFGLISVFLLWKGHIWGFAVTYYISYFFDCMDGYYARKYNMVSKFGDMYDHVKDMIVTICVGLTLFLRNRHCPWSKLAIPLVVFAMFNIMMMAQLGCQEKIYGRTEESNCLSIYQNLCIGDPNRSVKFFRYFGCGTIVILFILLVVWVEKSNFCK